MDKQVIAQSLHSLHTFVCVGRHMSFAKAAEELCITPSAVSHRIRNLEELLGFALFHRFTRRIDFTAQGAMLFTSLDNTLGEIKTSIRDINNQQLNGNLCITCPPSFASVWLVERLPDFKRRFPGISVHMHDRNDLVDFENEDVDLAVYYSPGGHPGLSVTLLMEEFMTPVCSPAYADAHDLWGNAARLKDCTFLHDEKPIPGAPRHSEWNIWAKAAGLRNLPLDRCWSFDRWELAIKAAAKGMGVAIGRSVLIRDALLEGGLVQPFSLQALSAHAYFVVVRQEDTVVPRVAAFSNWLLMQANQSASPTPRHHPPRITAAPANHLVAEYCNPSDNDT